MKGDNNDRMKGGKRRLAIDKKLWRFKFHFFFFIGGIATVFPFIPNYVNKNIGISTTALAIILMAQQFLFIITKPIIGFLADYFNQLKGIICFLTLVQGLSFALILIIPKIDGTPNYSACHLEEELHSGGNSTAVDCETAEGFCESCQQSNEFLSYQFWFFAFVYTIGMVSNNAVFTLSDTACCESVEKYGADFGRQRLWGAIGWGLMAPLAGLLNDFLKSYIPLWICMEICLCLVIWNILKIELQKPHFSKNILKDVGTVLKSAEFLVFEAGLLMNGIGAAMIWNYLVLFLISIGASKLLCGLSLTVQSFIGTLPLMYFSAPIIKRMGHLNVCSLALMLYAVRFLWYSFLYNPWLVLCVESLHGFTYGLLYANIASFGKESAKPGTEATTQSLLFSTHEGLGGGIGCVLGGIGLDKVGGHQTFFIASLFTGCGFLLHELGAQLVQRRKGNIKISPETTDHKV